jgi:hypothetical protein
MPIARHSDGCGRIGGAAAQACRDSPHARQRSSLAKLALHASIA